MSDVIDADFQDVDDSRMDTALIELRGSPHWPVLLGFLKERRESWIADSRITSVYQNHSELVHVTARISELDHLITLFK